MGAMHRTRTTIRRAAGSRKRAEKTAKLLPTAPQQVFFRICKAGWAVIVEKVPAATGTRFVCPFCPNSHRVPGPVRGFRKMRRAQWIKLRRAGE